MQNTARNALAVIVLLFSCGLHAATPEVADPSQWPWGADERRLSTLFPRDTTRAGALGYQYTGSLALLGETVRVSPAHFMLDPAKGVQRVLLFLAADDWRRVQKVLERRYGKPRYANAQSGKVFTHYIEWSTPTFGASASISTLGEDPTGPVYATPGIPGMDAQVTFNRGPLEVSAVDTLVQNRALLREAFRQAELQERVAAQRNEEAAREREAQVRRPPPLPTQDEALAGVRAIVARRAAGCDARSDPRGDGIERILQASGDRAASELLAAGLSVHERYYADGRPASCAIKGSATLPLVVSAMHANNAAAVTLYAKSGADLETISAGSMCLVQEAAWRSTPEVLRALLQAGARCSARPEGLRDVVQEVVSRQSVEKLQVLFEFGQRVDPRDLGYLNSQENLPKLRLVVAKGQRWNDEATKQAALQGTPDVLETLARARAADATAMLRIVVTPNYSYGEEPQDSKRVERARRLLANGALVAANGTLYPEVAAALTRATTGMRQLLTDAAERTLPGSTANLRAVQQQMEAKRYVLDLSACQSDLHVVRATGGRSPVTGRPIEWAAADVTFAVTDKPGTLVLLAYNPTRWRVRASPGARLERIVALGYHTQVVESDERAPVMRRSYDTDHFAWSFSDYGGKDDGPLARTILAQFGTEPRSIQRSADATPLVVDGSRGARPPFTCTSTQAAPATTRGPDKFDRMVEEAMRRGKAN